MSSVLSSLQLYTQICFAVRHRSDGGVPMKGTARQQEARGGEERVETGRRSGSVSAWNILENRTVPLAPVTESKPELYHVW